MNGIALAIAIAMIKLVFSRMEQHDHISLAKQRLSTVENWICYRVGSGFRK
jgi:hypothetical protein